MANKEDIPALEHLREDLPNLPALQRLILRRRIVDRRTQPQIEAEINIPQPRISEQEQKAYEELGVRYVNPRNAPSRADREYQQQLHEQIKKAFDSVPLQPDEIALLEKAKGEKSQQPITSTTQPQPEPTPITPPHPPNPAPGNPPSGLEGIAGEMATGQTPRVTTGIRWRPILIGLGLFALGAVVFALLRPAPPPQVVIATATLGPSQTPIVEVMVMTPSESVIAPLVAATMEAMPTQTPLILRETRVATATPGPSPTPIIVTATPLPEAPTTPEPQTPTELPTPTPQPTQVGNLIVPFEDNFDSAWRPEWDPSGGRLSLASGRLTSASDLPFVLWLGDDKLTDYTVEFDYVAGWGIDLYVGPNFRWLDRFGNTVNGYSPRHWQEKKPSTNQWTQISPEFFNMQSGRFKLVVQGDTYLLSVNNGDPVEYVIAGIKPKGPFGIGLQRNTFIDNFRLSVP